VGRGGFRDWGVLIPAGILLLIGFGGFAFTLGNVTVFQNILQWWPLLLIFFGIIILIQAVRAPALEVSESPGGFFRCERIACFNLRGFTIGIDASRSVASQPTGTEWYSHYLIEALLDHAR